MGIVRKLRFHPRAVKTDELPPIALLTKYTTVSDNAHWFWQERGRTRLHDLEGQALLRWRGRTYNVTRVFLQHRLRTWLVRAVNACGLPQCVNPDHWAVQVLSPAKATELQGLATILVNQAWRLSVGGVVATRDVTFAAIVTPAELAPRHLVRALYEEHETEFRTACGLDIDPAFVVAGGVASCVECLR